jgi:hypothetical protein
MQIVFSSKANDYPKGILMGLGHDYRSRVMKIVTRKRRTRAIILLGFDRAARFPLAQ